MDKIDPGNPDYVRQWGLLILKDKSLAEDQRNPLAEEVWIRLVEANPNEALVATQVADLLRQAEITDKALSLYQKAVELAPDKPEYREYLGQYYHVLDRRDEALQAWRPIAAGDRRNARNLSRLAEVLSRFAYREEAIAAGKEATELDPQGYETNFSYAELLQKGDRHEEALRQLEVAARLASNDHQRQAVIDRQIQSLQQIGRLAQQIDVLTAELNSAVNVSSRRWRQLAHYCRAERRMSEAMRAAKAAIDLDDQSIASRRLAAQIYDSAGSLAEAADAYRKLATLDPPLRTEYLTNLAEIEVRLGRTEEALEAGRQVIAAAPGNSKHHQSLAELCFKLGKVDEGLAVLRRAAALDPTQLDQQLVLAEALAQHYMTSEAIELYWQALDKSRDVKDKLLVVSRLAGLYLRISRFDRLMDRLQRMRRTSDNQRQWTFCIAQAHLEARDYAAGRAELELLLTGNDRDGQLLAQLSSLAEQDGDVEAAIGYQLRLIQLTPTPEAKERLAQLYLAAGRADEAETVLAELVLDEEEPHRLVQSIDSLIFRFRYDAAMSVTGRILGRQPDNWEMLYREGMMLALGDKPNEAKSRFQAILSLLLPDDTKGAKARALSAPGPVTGPGNRQGVSKITARSYEVHQIRQAAGLVGSSSSFASLGQSYYVSTYQPQSWVPDDFGLARMASIAWLTRIARWEGTEKELVDHYDTTTKQGQNQRALWDAYYFHSVRDRPDMAYQVAKQLSKAGDVEAQVYYLRSLIGRGAPTQTSGEPAALSPLEDAEVDHMLACYRNVRKHQPKEIDGVILRHVLADLRWAKRQQEEQAVYREALESADDPDSLDALAWVTADRGDVENLLAVLDKTEQASAGSSGRSQITNIHGHLSSLMPKLALEKRYAEILQLLDRYLELAGRHATSHPGFRPLGVVPSSSASYMVYTSGSSRRRISLEYPTPNEYYDSSAISMLRSVFEIFGEGDKRDTLVRHFQDRVRAAEGRQQLMGLLALSYLSAWTGDRNAAAEDLKKAVSLADHPTGLLFDLAQLQSRLGDQNAALETLDAIDPVDQSTLVRREQTVLPLAKAKGDLDRARTAAKRLFGVQLDVNQQLWLASELRTLDLKDLAEVVLHRAHRRSGSNTGDLQTIMNSYLSQGKQDLAIQVAHQILRRPRSTSLPASIPGPSSMSSPSGSDPRKVAMKVLAGSGKLEELIQETESQWQRSPNSAELMRTLVDYYIAAETPQKATPILESFLTDDSQAISPNALVAVAMELESQPDLLPVVIRAYEHAFHKMLVSSSDPYREVVLQRLLSLYGKASRSDDARELLLQCYAAAGGKRTLSMSAYTVDSRIAIAQNLHELGFPADAFHAYRKLASEWERRGGADPGASEMARHCRSVIEQMYELTPEAVLGGLPGLMSPEGAADSDSANDPAIDLVVLVKSPSPANARVWSPVTVALKAVGQTRPSIAAKLRPNLERIAASRPDDVSVIIASAMLELGSGKLESSRPFVQRLVELGEKMSLEQAETSHLAKRSRLEMQIALWLVARECIPHDILRPSGEKLATRSLDAARQEDEKDSLTAILWELGQLFLKQEDVDTAQKHFRELLAALVDRDALKGRPVTTATFSELHSLSKMMLDLGMFDVSLACIREGLRAGAPRAGQSATAQALQGSLMMPRPVYTSRGVIWAVTSLRSSSSAGKLVQTVSVEQTVTEMDGAWRQHNLPPEKVYETLLGLVFPEDLPDEIQLYTRRMTESDMTDPQSVGRLLVARAIEARKTDDLRRRIALRKEQAADELPGLVLQLQLAVATGDTQFADSTLDGLKQRLAIDKQYPTARLACHGIMLALDSTDFNVKAASAFELAANNLAEPPGDRIAAAMRMALLSTAIQVGNTSECIRQLQAYRRANGNTVVKVNSPRRHKMQMMDIAMGLAQVGELADSMMILGDFVAKPNVFGRGQSASSLVHLILRQMDAISPSRRYDLLKSWVLPSEDRDTIRGLAYFPPTQYPPAVFLPAPLGLESSASGSTLPSSASAPGGVVSFFEMLIAAAVESGELQQLAIDLEQATDAEFKGTEDLLVLVRLALGDHEAARPRVEQLLAELKEYLDSEPGHRRLIRRSHYQMARGCMANEQTRELGEELAEVLMEQARRLRELPYAANLARQLATQRYGADQIGVPAADPQLPFWAPVFHQRSFMNQSGTPPALWAVRDGRVTHVAGPELSFLYFKYPLAGSFDVSVDGYAGRWAESGVAFGGIAFEPLEDDEDTRLWLVGEHDQIRVSQRVGLAEQYNRLTIQVRPESVRYLCNEKLLYEDQDPSPTSPWLALVARGDRTTSWQNISISGTPTIPREIHLTHAERLEGWTARHFYTWGHNEGGMPRGLSARDSQAEASGPVKLKPVGYEWSAWDGVIHGRRVDPKSAGGPVQSWLAYHRPIAGGETVSYEFLHEPGRTMGHPTIGRLAFMFEPDGVRLHWITDDRRDMSNGLAADNSVEVASERRGPEKLPLEDNAWNAAEISLVGDVVTLRLNGVEVYQRRLESSNRRLFGLFHYSDRTAVQVRNVRLRGDWPLELPQTSGLFETGSGE